jgi:intein/homing endonuclease
MAKVYAEQGNLGKAVEIYKYLLEKEPGRQDLVEALSEIKKKDFNKNRENLSRLLNEWINLLLKYNSMQKLKKLQKYLGDVG